MTSLLYSYISYHTILYHTIPTDLPAGAGTGQFSTFLDVGGGVGGVGGGCVK